MAIESNADSSPVRIRLDKLTGSKIDTTADTSEVNFDVDVKMDEEGRTNDELTLSFLLTISTKPSLVQFEAGGRAVIRGGRKAFDAALEVDDSAGVPKILFTIYQRVVTSLFLVSSLLDAPYPPPDLIHYPGGTRELSPEDQMVIDEAQVEQPAQ